MLAYLYTNYYPTRNYNQCNVHTGRRRRQRRISWERERESLKAQCHAAYQNNNNSYIIHHHHQITPPTTIHWHGGSILIIWLCGMDWFDFKVLSWWGRETDISVCNWYTNARAGVGYRRVKDATVTTTKVAQQNICESKGDLDGFAIAYFVCTTLWKMSSSYKTIVVIRRGEGGVVEDDLYYPRLDSSNLHTLIRRYGIGKIN